MSSRRIAALYAIILLGFAIVICRLYLTASNDTYATRAQNQGNVTLSLPARRGNFYDCDGLPLTGLATEYYALCLPGESSYTNLYNETDSAGQALLYRKRNSAAPFLLRVNRSLSNLGVYTVAAQSRYCTVPLCQHLIGYLDGEGKGVSGLERVLNPLLAGNGGHDAVECTVTGQGKLADGASPIYTNGSYDGLGVQLTISRPIQRGVEAIAAETMSTGCILVLDAATAQVRASVSVPGYDPDNLAASLSSKDSPLLNRVLAAYAAGSVFKPVLAIAALETGEGELTIECQGYTLVDGQIYRCASGVAHGETDLAMALEKSCNCYFIRLGQQLGTDTVRSTAAALGFGEAVELYGTLCATAGVLPDERELASTGQLANFSFGQGRLLVTPVQIAGMMNAIAANGIYRSPSFLMFTVDEMTGEPVESLAHSTRRRVFSTQTARRLRELLCGVVENGTGHEAAPIYDAAGGKTGTAQTGQFNNAGQEKMNYWFAGFYPVEHPHYTVVVLQDGQVNPAFSSAAIFAKVCDTLALLEQ